jgi:hypothetical protein
MCYSVENIPTLNQEKDSDAFLTPEYRHFSNKAVEATLRQEIKPILLVSGTTIAVNSLTAVLQGAKP